MASTSTCEIQTSVTKHLSAGGLCSAIWLLTDLTFFCSYFHINSGKFVVAVGVIQLAYSAAIVLKLIELVLLVLTISFS